MQLASDGRMENYMEIIIIIIAILVLIILKVWYDERKEEKRRLQRLMQAWGKEDTSQYTPEKMEFIQAFYRSNMQEGDVDDITWNDLEMDLIYQRMNHTRSAMGQEYLYALLRRPQQDSDALEEREDLIAFFQEQESQRLDLQMQLDRIGRPDRFSVYSYLSNVKNLKKESSVLHIVQMLALFASVALCLVWPSQLILVAIVIAIFNMISYYQRKAEMDKYYLLLAYIVKMVHFAREVSQLKIPRLQPYFDVLRSKAKLFDHFCRGSWLVIGGSDMQGDLWDTLMNYIRLLTHIDIIKFQSMSREAIQLEGDLLEMYQTIGFLDSMVAVASYREMMEDYCVPQLTQTGVSGQGKGTEKKNTSKQGKSGNKGYLKAKQLYHPLISDPVKNDIDAERSVLLTGSNASGKSTFIKTVAINAILAQTVMTVLADSYETSYFRIYSSMALRDDIMSSESYYIVEIKSLKRIVDESQREGAPVLCFIDEVLRGTNTVERIAASSQILAMLAGTHSLCFAATHDIELTKMLEKFYDNYHFEEQVKGKDVIFDYRLRQGKALTRNAIKLLGMIGYQEDLIRRAEDSVQHFLESGDWERI